MAHPVTTDPTGVGRIGVPIPDLGKATPKPLADALKAYRATLDTHAELDAELDDVRDTYRREDAAVRKAVQSAEQIPPTTPEIVREETIALAVSRVRRAANDTVRAARDVVGVLVEHRGEIRSVLVERTRTAHAEATDALNAARDAEGRFYAALSGVKALDSVDLSGTMLAPVVTYHQRINREARFVWTAHPGVRGSDLAARALAGHDLSGLDTPPTAESEAAVAAEKRARQKVARERMRRGSVVSGDELMGEA